ncbi:hypothetical protein TNCV_2237541 [Trichonephila clavipes]|nr:hypothetical protein TNCV_2237541 [Trichonephila clavipes]
MFKTRARQGRLSLSFFWCVDKLVQSLLGNLTLEASRQNDHLTGASAHGPQGQSFASLELGACVWRRNWSSKLKSGNWCPPIWRHRKKNTISRGNGHY